MLMFDAADVLFGIAYRFGVELSLPQFFEALELFHKKAKHDEEHGVEVLIEMGLLPPGTTWPGWKKSPVDS